MGKGAGSVSIIGGADGPTSIFIAGKGSRVKLTTRIGNHFRKLKRNRVSVVKPEDYPALMREAQVL